METVQSHLRQALLSTTTRDMTEHSDQAQAAADLAMQQLDGVVGNDEDAMPSAFGEPKVERRFVDAAVNALSIAVTEAEKVALAADVDGMRARLVDFKTRVDFADAFLRASLGDDGVR
jgi:hypothetical protein